METPDNNEPCAHWCYTLNNPTDQEFEQLKAFTVRRHRCADEIGDSGTRHFQGALTFTRKYRKTQLCKLMPRTSWRKTKTPDPENYCTKGKILIDEKPKQGQRTDLKKVSELIKSGKSMEEIADETPNEFIKFHKGMTALQNILQPSIKKFTKNHVEVLWGEAGTGKTRKVYEDNENIYVVMKPQKSGVVWFDGYSGEDTLLIDDFDGWIDYTYLLHILDGYPLRVQIKGGTVKRNWTKVYITSNSSPYEWYDKELSAMLRRIDKIYQYKDNHIKENKMFKKDADQKKDISKKATQSPIVQTSSKKPIHVSDSSEEYGSDSD